MFLIVMICLCIFTWWQYRTWKEVSIKLWDSVVNSIIAFYFWQKVWEAKKDPLIDKTDKEVEQEQDKI